MNRTFVFKGLGHTRIRLPGASEKTEVQSGGTVTVKDPDAKFLRFLKFNLFSEVTEGAEAVKAEAPAPLENAAEPSHVTPENVAAVRKGRRK